MAQTRTRHRPSQLNSKELEELALAYVAKFATSRAKLRTYLSRKIRQSGWGEEGEPDLDGLAERLLALGYIDEGAFALGKSRFLANRGYGKRRLEADLKSAGISGNDAAEARSFAEANALESALRFARKRRIGPFSAAPMDRTARDKAIAAMIRAGHPLGLAQQISRLPPRESANFDDLREELGQP